MQLLMVGLLLVLVLDYSASMWLKQYNESYHRPTYYNKRHKSSDHVDYNRKAFEQTPRPRFDPVRDISYYVHVTHHASVICSGALISRRMVITSVFCFLSDEAATYSARDMGVVTGGQFAMSDPHAVMAFYMPVYAYKTDITTAALLSLKTKLDRKVYRYIKLYRKVPEEGDRVKIAFLDPKRLRIKHMSTEILKNDQCKSFYALHRIRVPPDYICVRNRPNNLKTTCSTRHGDPLVVGNKLAAINIFGEHCSDLPETVNMDIYLPIGTLVKYLQQASDSLRALTKTGKFSASMA